MYIIYVYEHCTFSSSMKYTEIPLQIVLTKSRNPSIHFLHGIRADYCDFRETWREGWSIQVKHFDGVFSVFGHHLPPLCWCGTFLIF